MIEFEAGLAKSGLRVTKSGEDVILEVTGAASGLIHIIGGAGLFSTDDIVFL